MSLFFRGSKKNNMTLKDLLKDLEKLVGKKLVKERRRVNRALKAGNKMQTRNALLHLKELMRVEREKQKWKPRFCEKDYNSGDGFQTSTWGPPCWTFLHFASLNYIPERREGYEMLLNGLEKTLPCGHCRNNFGKNYAQAERAMLKKHGIDDIWACRKTFLVVYLGIASCCEHHAGKRPHRGAHISANERYV